MAEKAGLRRVATGSQVIDALEAHEIGKAAMKKSYPEVALLKQIKDVGALIALTYILLLEEPRRLAHSDGATARCPENALLRRHLR